MLRSLAMGLEMFYFSTGFVPLVLCLALSGLLVGCQPSPGNTVREFFQALESGDFERVDNSFVTSADEFYLRKLLMALETAPEGIEEKGGIEKIKILEETVDGDTAQVEYRIEFGDGSTEEGTVELFKEADGWRIEPLAK